MGSGSHNHGPGSSERATVVKRRSNKGVNKRSSGDTIKRPGNKADGAGSGRYEVVINHLLFSTPCMETKRIIYLELELCRRLVFLDVLSSVMYFIFIAN